MKARGVNVHYFDRSLAKVELLRSEQRVAEPAGVLF